MNPLAASLLDALAHLGRGSLVALWLPVLLWSAGAGAVLTADALVPLRRPRLRAGLLAAVLAALPLGLALRALVTGADGRMGAAVDGVTGAARLVLPEWTVVATGAAAPSRPVAEMLGMPTATPWLVLGAAVVLAAAWTLVALARHVRAHRALSALLAASDAAPRAVQARADALADRAGVSAPAVLLYDGAGPLAHRRAGVSTVCLPRDLAADDDALTLALAHEIAHIAHGDLSGLAAERLVGSLFAWHPLARIAAARLDLRREQACDAAVVAAHPAARRAYADLLVRVATRPAPALPLAASMAVRPTTLRRRIAALLTPLSTRRAPSARLAAAGLALVLTLGAAVPFGGAAPIGSATAFATPSATFSVPAAPTDPAAPDDVPGIAADPVLLNRAELDAQANLRVPEIARMAGMSATVEVRVTIGDGDVVTDAAIARSDNELFDAPALVVARMARYTVPETPGQTAVLPLSFNALAPPPPPAPPAPPYESLPLSDGAPADFETVDRQPEPITQVDPVYPEAAWRDSAEARVTLRAWVTASGQVRAVRILRISDPRDRSAQAIAAGSTPHDAAFAEATRAAFLRWTFQPAMRGGVPVDVWVTIPFRFRLGSTPAAASAPTTAATMMTPSYASNSRCFSGRLTFPLDPGDDLLLENRPVRPDDVPALECYLPTVQRSIAEFERMQANNPSDRGFDTLLRIQRSNLAAVEAAITRLR